jgi:hypothetical protein
MTTRNTATPRARALAIVAAAIMLVSCLLPWYTFVGDLPATSFRGWDGSGVLVFIAAVATLAVLAFPASATRPEGPAQRPIVYALLATIAVLGVVLWPLSFLDRPSGLLPDRAPGLWLAVAGAAVSLLAAREMVRRRVRR